MQGNVSTPSGNAPSDTTPSDTTPSDTARANHDALFGEGVSTLARTDPELIAYFDTLAFDEVLADAAALDPGIDLHTRMLVQLAASLAAGGLAEFRVLAAAGLAHAGLSPVELKELVYQAVAYVGIARAFDYLHAVNDALSSAGVTLPLPGQAACTPATRLDYGKSVQAKIIGGAAVVEARLADAPADTRHFQRYLAANCFGVPYVGYPRALNALAAIDDICVATVPD